ncbi:hypothetical protein CVT23_11565 [Minwuia thermotolerans]|uniref:Uncharacterized protein n=2 Tax=Minwuia thermotolerans TaxID=2056226 RepID=A0A2M9G1X9_9PROT|nr:hypothetical protein CVT23_11565 [Minwuia thermotolerans]
MLMASTALAADENVDATPGASTPMMESTRSDPGVPSDALEAGPNITAGATQFNEVLIDDYEDVEMTDGTVYREPRTVRFDTDADGQFDTEGQVVSYYNRADDSSIPALYYVDIDGDRDPETWIIRRSELATGTDAEYAMREDARFAMRDDVEADDEDRFFFDPEFDFWDDDDDLVYEENDETITLVGSQRSPGAPASATGQE